MEGVQLLTEAVIFWYIEWNCISHMSSLFLAFQVIKKIVHKIIEALRGGVIECKPILYKKSFAVVHPNNYEPSI